MDSKHLRMIGLNIVCVNAGPEDNAATDENCGNNDKRSQAQRKSEFMSLDCGGSSSVVVLSAVAQSDGFGALAGTQAAFYAKDKKRLGLDFGGVITIYDRGEGRTDEDTTLADKLPGDHFTPGCFEAVTALVRHVGPQNVFIVSKAGRAMAEKSCKLLHEVDFFARTGFLDDGKHVFFCTERQMKQPIVQCLGITHFADDRWGILSQLPKNVHGCLFPSGANDGVASNPAPDLLKRMKEGRVSVGKWSTLCADLACPSELPSDRLEFCSKTKQWIEFSSG